jgi:hypothetical protein
MKYQLKDPERERERRRQHRARITTKEVHAAGGRAAGRIAADKVGFLDSIRTPETCSQGGKIGGRKVAESGRLSTIGLGIRTAESEAKGGRACCHLRWHVRRNRPNPRCEFCCEENLIIAFA